MKFTAVFITLLSISWALKLKNAEDPKGKRELIGGYPGSGASHSYQAPAFGHDDASAVSIGAGYSVGAGAGKPDYGYAVPEHGQFQGLQFQGQEGLPSNGHATIQLTPITLQPSHGFASNDLQQLMTQLSQSLNSGALSLAPSYQGTEGHGSHDISLSQLNYESPQLQQYASPEQGYQLQASVPSYAAGTKGLGSYSSTGPVLFNPSDSGFGGSQGHTGALILGGGGSSPSFADGSSFGHSLQGLSLGGGSGHDHAFSSFSLGNPRHSFGNSGHFTIKNLGHSLTNGLVGPGHAFGSGSFKGFGLPGKASFKPSAYLGSDSSIGGSYAPSFGSNSFSGGHGGLSLGSTSHAFGGSPASFGGGSNKLSYLPSKSESFESGASFAASASHSPPSTTYGFPSASLSHSGGSSTAAHAASSHSPQYYVKYAPSSSVGEGSSSFKGGPSHNSHRSKYMHSSSRYNSPQGSDSHGAHSEAVYNTIKYSEELKPVSRVH